MFEYVLRYGWVFSYIVLNAHAEFANHQSTQPDGSQQPIPRLSHVCDVFTRLYLFPRPVERPCVVSKRTAVPDGHTLSLFREGLQGSGAKNSL